MKSLTIFTVYIFLTFSCFAQTDRLVALGKVWGFLKYFHPAAATGKIDMDSVLFRMIPLVQGSDPQQFPQLIEDMIGQMGPVLAVSRPGHAVSKNTFSANHNLRWLSNRSTLGEAASAKLMYILDNRHRGPGYYAGRESIMKYFIASNEKLYDSAVMSYPDPLKRLMVLFRYWNIIEYFFPYKYVIGKNWDDVLRESIPAFLDAADTVAYHSAMIKLVNSVEDSHSGYFDRVVIDHYQQYMFPFNLTIINDTAVVTEIFNDSLTKLQGIKRGDLITGIDSKTIREKVAETLPLVGGSNLSRKLMQLWIYGLPVSGRNRNATITLVKDGKEQQQQIMRYSNTELQFRGRQQKQALKFEKTAGNIMVANVGSFTPSDLHAMMKAAEGTKAMILDIRNYPMGLHGLFTSYLTTKKTKFASVMIPDFQLPGTWKWEDDPGLWTEPNRKRQVYKGKVFVLVDERTQSQAEFTVMALQACENVITIGSQTSGADGPTSLIRIPGGFETHLTAAGIFYPDKTPTQRVGIRIDIEVKPTIKGVQENRDEEMERAMLEAGKIANAQ